MIDVLVSRLLSLIQPIDYDYGAHVFKGGRLGPLGFMRKWMRDEWYTSNDPWHNPRRYLGWVVWLRLGKHELRLERDESHG